MRSVTDIVATLAGEEWARLVSRSADHWRKLQVSTAVTLPEMNADSVRQLSAILLATGTAAVSVLRGAR